MAEMDELAAIPFLALCAARRAIAADPDHPDGYLVLSHALADPSLGMSEEERMLARMTALRQFLMRLPPPERYRKGAVSRARNASLRRSCSGSTRRDAARVWGQHVNQSALLHPPGGICHSTPSRLARRSSRSLQSARQNHQIVAGPFLFPHDTARDILLMAEKYLPIDFENEEERKRQNDDLQNMLKAIDTQYRIPTTSMSASERKRGTGGSR